MTDWRETMLGDVIDIFDYKRVPLSSAQRANRQGPFPYYGAQGIIDHIDDFIFDGRFILIPEDGENLRSRKLPVAYFADGQFWVNNHAHIVRAKQGIANDRFIQSALAASDIGAFVTGAAQPKLSQANLKRIPLLLPPPEEQALVGDILDAFDDLIENNRRRVEVLEETARAIYREWFVHFRYPGHEDIALVDSILGPIPEGWWVRSVADIASQDRYAVTGGPFGSKLGRKDYVDEGVPVLRGANLRVGGGFDESGLVFVSEQKAEELASSIARPGDVVITQRGTLGQIGIIPPCSLHDRYVLSQSQMKVTVDPEKLTATFLYAQMRSPATTQRFIAQAMTAGVPHVNLSLLRAFEILAPPLALQVQFSDVMEAMLTGARHLSTEGHTLADLRDLVLPKLVTGQLDVSALALDPLLDEKVA